MEEPIASPGDDVTIFSTIIADTIDVAYSAPVSAATAVFLIYPSGKVPSLMVCL